MLTGTRVLYLGLDACDRDVVSQFVAEGDLPNLGRLLGSAAVVATEAPLAVFPGAVWPTVCAGVGPARHGYLCWDEVRGGTYEYRRTNTDDIRVRPFWDACSDVGKRVAILDVPQTPVPLPVNGVQLSEWGGHDRRRGTSSWPPSFLEAVNARYGEHPIGCLPHPTHQFSPCDWAYREGERRTADENAQLLADLLEGIRRKGALCRDVLAEDRWDLFFAVFGESHCVGHQYWFLHDADHPHYDAELRARLGGDPMRMVYAALDAAVGEVLAVADSDTAVYVHLSLGMQAKNDGTALLDPILWRLDQYAGGNADRGWRTRGAELVTDVAPEFLRRRALAAASALRRRRVGGAPPGFFADEVPPRAPALVGAAQQHGHRRGSLQRRPTRAERPHPP